MKKTTLGLMIGLFAIGCGGAAPAPKTSTAPSMDPSKMAGHIAPPAGGHAAAPAEGDKAAGEAKSGDAAPAGDAKPEGEAKPEEK